MWRRWIMNIQRRGYLVRMNRVRFTFEKSLFNLQKTVATRNVPAESSCLVRSTLRFSGEYEKLIILHGTRRSLHLSRFRYPKIQFTVNALPIPNNGPHMPIPVPHLNGPHMLIPNPDHHHRGDAINGLQRNLNLLHPTNVGPIPGTQQFPGVFPPNSYGGILPVAQGVVDQFLSPNQRNSKLYRMFQKLCKYPWARSGLKRVAYKVFNALPLPSSVKNKLRSYYNF